LNEEYLREEKHELDEYRNFKNRFLGKDGAFSEFKIAIGLFYPYPKFDLTVGEELKKKGFKYLVY
jgi:hypothetical protein